MNTEKITHNTRKPMNAIEQIQATGQKDNKKNQAPGAGLRAVMLVMLALYALGVGWAVVEMSTDRYKFDEHIQSFWSKGTNINFNKEDGNIVAVVRLDHGWENTPFGLGLSPDTNSVIVARFVYPVAQYNKKTAENLISEIKQDIVGMASGRGAENFDGFAQASVFAFFGSRVSNLKMSVMFFPFVLLFLVIGLNFREFAYITIAFLCLNLAVVALAGYLYSGYLYSNDGDFETIKTFPIHAQAQAS